MSPRSASSVSEIYFSESLALTKSYLGYSFRYQRVLVSLTRASSAGEISERVLQLIPCIAGKDIASLEF